jgi:hypothetical protein
MAGVQELRSLVTDHRPCTVEEITIFRRYQEACSCVAPVLISLLDGGKPLTRAVVRGVTKIGAMKTFFGNIGGVSCRSIAGSDRFRVAEATDVLRNTSFESDPEVRKMRETVERYAAIFRKAQSDPKVTIVDSANDCLIADGNKTALAAFLHASSVAGSRFELPVYYLAASDCCIPWLL